MQTSNRQEVLRRYVENNKEKVKESKKRYRETHKKELALKSKIYREKNKNIIKAKRKIYRAKNKEKRMLYNKIYREENSEKVRESRYKHYKKFGISLSQRWRFTKNARKWTFFIYKKYNYTCQNCGKSHCRIFAHHIKSAKDYPELRYDINNGRCLCKECHYKIHYSHGNVTHSFPTRYPKKSGIIPCPSLT